MNLNSFLDELTKIARTRYAREAANALSAGDEGTFNQIAQAHEQLGLKNREVKALGGGYEGGAFLNLGKAPGQVGGPNHHVEKFYNPMSFVTRGNSTQRLVEQKKEVTDAARAMSPEARAMVPEMYGHESRGQGPLQRTRSTHEFVQGATSLKNDPNRSDKLDAVEHNVLNPLRRQGMTMGDTITQTGPTSRTYNSGNVVSTPSGPKVLDFLPHQQGKAFQPEESFARYAPGMSNDNQYALMSPEKARAEFFNPKLQAHAPGDANPNLAREGRKYWNQENTRPSFEAHDQPFGQRMRQQEAQVQQQATVRPQRSPTPAPAPTVAPRRPAVQPPPAAASAPTIRPPARTPAPVGALAKPATSIASTMRTVAPKKLPLPAHM